MNTRPDRGPGRLGRAADQLDAGGQPARGRRTVAAQIVKMGQLERADDRDRRLAGLAGQRVGTLQAGLGFAQQPLDEGGPADLEQRQGRVVRPEQRGQFLGRGAGRRRCGERRNW